MVNQISEESLARQRMEIERKRLKLEEEYQIYIMHMQSQANTSSINQLHQSNAMNTQGGLLGLPRSAGLASSMAQLQTAHAAAQVANAKITHKSITVEEHEMFIEARNFIADIASDETIPEGYRDQAKRMISRLVLSKV